MSIETLDDFFDPTRNIKAATARAEQALDHWTRGDHYAQVLEQLEKAHTRLERAQAEIAVALVEDGTPWEDIGAPLALTANQARRRFSR